MYNIFGKCFFFLYVFKFLRNYFLNLNAFDFNMNKRNDKRTRFNP